MYNFNPIVFILFKLINVVTILIFIALLFSLVLKATFRDEKFVQVLLYYFSFGIPVCLTGYVTGYVSGLSRVAVIGTVLPAVLALLGGVNIYVFGTDNRYKIVVGYCVSVFMFMLFLGIEAGAYQREANREPYLRYLSEQEFRIRSFRDNLGLPKDIPPWMKDGAGSKTD